MRFSGSVSLRPVRAAFLVPPDDLGVVSRAAQLSACMWGGRYNPIIPFFETGGERWTKPYSFKKGLDVARGYIDFFEPDTLIETAPGMAEKLGWHAERSGIGLPRTLPFEKFYNLDSRGRAEFATGVDVFEVIQDMYDKEYKYERRHKQEFATIQQSDGNAFFDVVGGRYPADESLAYIRDGFREAFGSEDLDVSASTAMKFLTAGCAGPLWVTRHGLEETLGNGSYDQVLYVFDPGDAGDIIDFWNYRLVYSRVIPFAVNWIAEHQDFLRECILTVHRPIPGNPFGTMFHSGVLFGASISADERAKLVQSYLTDLPEGSFYIGYPPSFWDEVYRGGGRRYSKVIATAKRTSFDEEVGSERYLKLPAPVPEFVNATHRYLKARWVNLVAADGTQQRPDPATIYPSNLWSPGYPQLGSGRDLRIGREGWAIQQEHKIGYSLLEPQDGRAAIIGWLKTKGIEATPSEEGQIAARIVATAETLLGCGMYADRKTLQLLNEMAESHTEVSRNGRRKLRSTPDRSKHYQAVRRHFDDRSRRSFGYWNDLKHFLKLSVFRAGLQVQCPVCSYQNWLAVDSLSYRPTCTRCLNQFDFLQTPEGLHRIDWYYRVTGPFAAPDYARGGYAVALTLRILAQRHDAEMTWSTGLKLQPLNREIDFIAWHRSASLGTSERDEPLVVLGEVKSFGVGSVNDETIAALQDVAEKFPGAVMVVASLREIGEYSLEEIARLRRLALWGRRTPFPQSNPLIILTGTELFADHGISNAWKKVDGKEVHPSYDFNDLYTLADMTQHRYLGLESRWHRDGNSDLPDHMSRLLAAIRFRSRIE